MGHTNDHPTALEFKYRFRNQIIGRNCKYISPGANVSEDTSENMDLFRNLVEKGKNETPTPITFLSVDFLSDLMWNDGADGPEDTFLSANEESNCRDGKECEDGGLEYLAGYLAHVGATKYGYRTSASNLGRSCF